MKLGTFPLKAWQYGFSLIELLIVVSIIAMLAGFVAPKYFSRIAISERQVARAQIDNLDKAVTQYRLDTGHYPDAAQGLQALGTAPFGETRWRGPYLKKPLTLDPWGNAYVFKLLDEDGVPPYLIISYGHDGRPGGDGEDADITSPN